MQPPRLADCEVECLGPGGMVGTFVNSDKIDATNPFGLNCGEQHGGGKETFVYRL